MNIRYAYWEMHCRRVVLAGYVDSKSIYTSTADTSQSMCRRDLRQIYPSPISTSRPHHDRYPGQGDYFFNL